MVSPNFEAFLCGMIGNDIIKKSLADLFKHSTENSDIVIDLGLNKWGRGKFGLLVEMYLLKDGYRALTDQEINSWKTLGDVIATIKEAKKTRVRPKRGPKPKLPVA